MSTPSIASSTAATSTTPPTQVLAASLTSNTQSPGPNIAFYTKLGIGVGVPVLVGAVLFVALCVFCSYRRKHRDLFLEKPPSKGKSRKQRRRDEKLAAKQEKQALHSEKHNSSSNTTTTSALTDQKFAGVNTTYGGYNSLPTAEEGGIAHNNGNNVPSQQFANHTAAAAPATAAQPTIPQQASSTSAAAIPARRPVPVRSLPSNNVDNTNRRRSSSFSGPHHPDPIATSPATMHGAGLPPIAASGAHGSPGAAQPRMQSYTSERSTITSAPQPAPANTGTVTTTISSAGRPTRKDSRRPNTLQKGARRSWSGSRLRSGSRSNSVENLPSTTSPVNNNGVGSFLSSSGARRRSSSAENAEPFLGGGGRRRSSSNMRNGAWDGTGERASWHGYQNKHDIDTSDFVVPAPHKGPKEFERLLSPHEGSSAEEQEVGLRGGGDDADADNADESEPLSSRGSSGGRGTRARSRSASNGAGRSMMRQDSYGQNGYDGGGFDQPYVPPPTAWRGRSPSAMRTLGNPYFKPGEYQGSPSQ